MSEAVRKLHQKQTADAARANVLLVDDDSRNLMALQELLQDIDANLICASSGEEALRCVLRSSFAVILLDVRMPELDGFEVAKLMRQHPDTRHTPIIFLTGMHADTESIFRGYQAGAVDYIIKPFIPQVLKSKVLVFIELYAKNAALAREIAVRNLVAGQLRDSEESLRALTGHLESVREEERKRIASVIHDELGQALAGIKMELTWLASGLDERGRHLLSKAKTMCGLIDDTVHAIRRIAAGLRPGVLDDVGLPAAIEWQARDFRMRTGIRCQVALPPGSVELDRDLSTAAFRIFQELLTNVARHAGATRVDVQVRLEENALLLDVRDNGKGIATTTLENPKSLGLLGMRERAQMFGGKIDILGNPGRGTRARVSIPLQPH